MYSLNRRIGIFAAMLAVIALLSFITGCHRPNVRASQAPPPAAEELRKVARLNETAEAAYRKAAEGDFLEARTKLRELGAQIIGMHFNGITSVEGLEALSTTVAEAMRTFNAVRIQPDQALLASAKVRLSVDALDRRKDPLWLEYYKVIQEDIQALDRSAQSQYREGTLQALESYRSHYFTIRPAAAVSRQPEEVSKPDSLLKALETQLKEAEPKYANVLTLLRHMEEAIDALFHKKDADTAYLPLADPNGPIYWTFAVAALIFAALGYTGWRMFNSDKRLTSSKIRRDGDRQHPPAH